MELDELSLFLDGAQIWSPHRDIPRRVVTVARQVCPARANLRGQARSKRLAPVQAGFARDEDHWRDDAVPYIAKGNLHRVEALALRIEDHAELGDRLGKV